MLEDLITLGFTQDAAESFFAHYSQFAPCLFDKEGGDYEKGLMLLAHNQESALKRRNARM